MNDLKQRKFNFSIIISLFLCLNYIGIFQVQAQKQTKIIGKKFKTNAKNFQHIPRKNSTPIITQKSAANCTTRQPNRSIDGTCNNLTNNGSEWGAADVPLSRKMPAQYDNPDPYNDMAGSNRKSPREISNIVSAQSASIESGDELSSFVFTWGQFLDHDIDLTPEGETEYHPITMPANEPLFTSDIPFFRSEIYPGTGTNTPREQTNLITSWIDASNVYGSEQSRADWLRTFTDGKLKTSAGNLLPYNTVDGELSSAIDTNAPSMAGDEEHTNKVFVAGDVRANEQPGLTTLHTLFVREHNRLCDKLKKQGINGDEQLYQLARKWVGAYMQQITFEEFLPALGVNLPNYSAYKNNVKPDITNVFATAAYRLGHTMVTEELLLIDDNCNDVDGGSLTLLEAFFNPSQVATHGIEPFLKGLSLQTQQEIDLKIIDNLRNFLFGDPTAPAVFGLDLASLNIQRGRDHGLPHYSFIREHYTNRRVRSFREISSDPTVQAALSAAYDGNVNNIDAWVGLLAEDHISGGSIGRTLEQVLNEQFTRLRDGDYYYFENDPAFSGSDRTKIKDTELSKIIERNTSLDHLPRNVFKVRECNDNDGDGGHHGDGHHGGGRKTGSVNTTTTSSTTAIDASKALTIFPNPNSGKFNLQVKLGVETTPFTIRISNLSGKIVHQQAVQANDGLYTNSMNIKDLPTGLYLLQVKTATQQYVKKLLIE